MDVPITEEQTENKPSIDVLKETKPSEDIPKMEQQKQEEGEKVEEKPEVLEKKGEEKKVETLKEPISSKSSQKNKSDIFSLNRNENMASTIFSVGGAPSKKINKVHNANLDSGEKGRTFRNPLTGIGVSSKDEFKNKPSKRKDGNPLLGVGYKDDADVLSGHTNQRIPPGGYSKGLW